MSISACSVDRLFSETVLRMVKHIAIFQKRLQLAVNKFFNDSIKNGKKRDRSVVVWISHIRVWTKRGLGHGLPYGLPYGLPVVDFLKLVSALL